MSRSGSVSAAIGAVSDAGVNPPEPSQAKSERSLLSSDLVHVTTHAVGRARNRHPERFSHISAHAVRMGIETEVSEAISEGRTGVKVPARYLRRSLTANGRDDDLRFAWTPSYGRVYVLAVRTNEVSVITALSKPGGDAA